MSIRTTMAVKLKRPKGTALAGYACLLLYPDDSYAQRSARWLTAINLFYPSAGRWLEKFQNQVTEYGIGRLQEQFRAAFLPIVTASHGGESSSNAPEQLALLLGNCASHNERELEVIAREQLSDRLRQILERTHQSKNPYEWLILSILEVLDSTA